MPSGKLVDPFDLQPEDIHIEDIALALSHIARYNGHTASGPSYTVGQHSVIACYGSAWESPGTPATLDEEAALRLFHDAAEYVLYDVPRPIKHRPEFKFYCRREGEVLYRILDRFGLVAAVERCGGKVDSKRRAIVELPPGVKLIDNRLLNTEQRDLRNHPDPEYPGAGFFQRRILPWDCVMSEGAFKHAFEELCRAGVVTR